MSADRLREAAGWLQSEADWVRTLGLSWQREAAMAALLRAVADDVAIGLYIVGAESPAAALALADTILGAES